MKGIKGSADPNDVTVTVASGAESGDHEITVVVPDHIAIPYPQFGPALVPPQRFVQDRNSIPPDPTIPDGFKLFNIIWNVQLIVQVRDQFRNNLTEIYENADVSEGGNNIHVKLDANGRYTDNVGMSTTVRGFENATGANFDSQHKMLPQNQWLTEAQYLAAQILPGDTAGYRATINISRKVEIDGISLLGSPTEGGVAIDGTGARVAILSPGNVLEIQWPALAAGGFPVTY